MAALDGMRVLDISGFESGPSCAQLLAWFGAEVVRIDPPSDVGLPATSALGENALHLANDHNKRSIQLDLGHPEGRALFYQLVPRFDVLIENFAFGVAEKLGLAYADLRPLNPALIYCTIKGFGLTGPYREYKVFDPVAQASGGAMSITGEPGGPPIRSGYVVADNVSGLTAVSGVLAAYVQRLRTGEGQLVEVSMQEAVLSMLRSALVRRDDNLDGVVPRRANRMTPPTDLYPCAPGGPSDYVQITVPLDRLFRRLMEVIGRAELADDPRFRTAAERLQRGDEICAEVRRWTLARTKWEAMDALARAGIPAAAVFDSRDIYADRHLAERGALPSVTHPVRGETRLPGNPVRLHGSPVAITAPPVIGEHTRVVLREELALDEPALDRLTDAGVIGAGRPEPVGRGQGTGKRTR